jgi:hypothetical protein
MTQPMQKSTAVIVKGIIMPRIDTYRSQSHHNMCSRERDGDDHRPVINGNTENDMVLRIRTQEAILPLSPGTIGTSSLIAETYLKAAMPDGIFRAFSTASRHCLPRSRMIPRRPSQSACHGPSSIAATVGLRHRLAMGLKQNGLTTFIE